MIWPEAYLQQLGVDAEQQINQDLQVIWTRVCFPITAGQSVYTLPDYFRSVTRITWRGRLLDPENWEDLTLLTPATAVVSETVKVEGTLGRPLFYAMHPTNRYDIRFFPTPSETFDATGDPFSPDIGSKCIISGFRSVDSTFSDAKALLPSYIDRRTRKAYILWKAFQAEGKGQNLKAAQFYSQKYQFLIAQFRKINEGCYIAKRYSIEDGAYLIDGFKYPRPILNAKFERTQIR